MYCINVKMSSYLLKLIFKNNLKDDEFVRILGSEI